MLIKLLIICDQDYYHSPRLWISGVSETGKPLTDKEIFEDIMNEYINETVSVMEVNFVLIYLLQHPHLGIRQVSIHPCKHCNNIVYFIKFKAEVMKIFIKKASENGGKIEPH